MIDPSLYEGREQTLIKHFLFGKYLERFAIIVGSWADAITYVDGFSGPWNTRSDKLEDSSFAIALAELRKARDVLKRLKNKDLKLRCFFIEKDPNAYRKLEEFAKLQTDVEIRTRNSELEEAVPEVVDFVRKGGKANFPFVFIDPKGWTGFALKTIKPILELQPCEVLINFQTGFIKRFVELETVQDEFDALFGDTKFRDKIKGLKKAEREQAMLAEYMRNLRGAGDFEFVCAAAVPRPESDRTHFHLIYATRDPKGVEVFKEAEFKSLPVMLQAQAEAKKAKRVAKSGQLEMFPSQDMHQPLYLEGLRERQLALAETAVQSAIRTQDRLAYDAAWVLALSHPLVWERDLKGWIQEWSQHWLKVEGLVDKERVPKRGKGHVLVVRKQA